MTDRRSFHADHGATFTSLGGREVVADYGRPDRTHLAVRRGVGVTEAAVDVIVVEGADRRAYVDNVVTNRVPAADGEGSYAFLLDPQGRIRADLYVLSAADRVLVFAPPGTADGILDGWEAFIQDVTFTDATESFAVFGVHGSTATQKVASVLTNASPPGDRLAFDRGSIADAGVTVVRDDGVLGEPGYLVACADDDGVRVLDALVNHGMNAVPFGRRVWAAAALEAGSPLFTSELEGRIPNETGVRVALDFEKGCYPGQEVVARVENRGRPSSRLVGLRCESPPADGAEVRAGDDVVGEVTRVAHSPVLDAAIAFAYVDSDLDADAVTVGPGGVEAEVVSLPFVDGGERSARIPTYPA